MEIAIPLRTQTPTDPLRIQIHRPENLFHRLRLVVVNNPHEHPEPGR